MAHVAQLYPVDVGKFALSSVIDLELLMLAL